MSEQQSSTILTHRQHALEVEMVGQARWTEIRRLHEEEGQSISAIARRMELNRKTVRRCVRARTWRPYQRRSQVDKLLTPHADWLQRRAPEASRFVRCIANSIHLNCTNSSGTNLDSVAGPTGENHMDAVCKSAVLAMCPAQAGIR